jgi:enterobactin synthetase component F
MPTRTELAGLTEDANGSPTPLTQAELGLWYAQKLDPSNPVFNTGQYLDIGGALDLAAFRGAIATAVAEADTLAIRIVERDGVAARVIDPASRPVLQHIDLRESADPEADALALMARDMATATDPARDPLAAQVLFTLSDDRHFWYQRIHHLAIDGYGTALITRRIADLYAASVSGTAPRTTPFGRLGDVVNAEIEYLSSARHETDRHFWHKEFADRPEPASLAPGQAMTAHHYTTCGAALPATVSDALATLTAASGVAWPDVLVALSAAYIQRHTDGDTAIIGVPSMERLGRPAARVPAMVMNILPARITVDEEVPLVEWLGAVAKHLQRLRRHGRYRSEQLRRDLGLIGGQRRLYGPLVNVLPFDDTLDLPGLRTSLHVLGTGPVDDLTITWRADGAGRGLRLELDGNPGLYDADELDAHAARLATFLVRATTAARLADVPTVTPDEETHWVRTVNATDHEIPDATLVELIEARMRATPDAPALRFVGITWSYGELDARSQHLARVLAARGVGRGHIVAVMAPRSFELVLALVSILRAGAAYLPIDPGYPPDRIAAMIESARPTLVLTLGHADPQLPAGVPMLALDGLDTVAVDAEVVPDTARQSDAAYVIFTSGSTGAPKGAVIEHRAIVNRLEWMRTFYEFTASDRLLQKTPATFDVSVWEFFLAFTSGALLVVAPPDAHKDPAWLASIIRSEGITTIHFVPSMLAAFLAEPAVRGLAMRRVFCSGEELPAALRDRFHEIMAAELHNLYGPTEAAVDVTWWNASRGDRSVPVPIGFPVWNTRMYILDDRLRAVPPGVAGHLYIAGVQLAREYLGRPDLTADRFVPDPFGASTDRMYRTGDLARWRHDGAITFLGRSDFQVKVRGFRIELGEIESVIAASRLVSQVAVVAREDNPGDKRLVAYVVGRETAPDLDAVRAHVASQLPEYMVPSTFVPLSELPLSHNGKLQRSALPRPDRPASRNDVRPAQNATERDLLSMFADVLDAQSTGTEPALSVEDDFFALGGHSLLAAQLMTRVRERWQIDVGLGLLFAQPTVARLAERVDALVSAGTVAPVALADVGLAPVIQIVKRDRLPAPPLFCIHPAGGLAWCYGGLARALEPARSVYGLQARGLDLSSALPESLDAMAADYVDQIRVIQPAGPYALAGWSVGGILAHAMGVRLESLGESVALLAMLDAYPCDRWRNEPPPDERAALKALLHIAGYDPATMPDVELTRTGVMTFLRQSGHPLGTLSDAALSGVVRVVHHNSRLVRQHRHTLFTGDVVYFRAALDHQGTTLSPQEWRPYVGGALEVHDVASLHAHLTGPAAAAAIAPVLDRHLREQSPPARR